MRNALILLSILILLLTNLKGLAALQRSLSLSLALQTEHQLLGLLRLYINPFLEYHLLMEDRLGLTTKTLLLGIVSSLSYIHNLPSHQHLP